MTIVHGQWRCRFSTATCSVLHKHCSRPPHHTTIKSFPRNNTGTEQAGILADARHYFLVYYISLRSKHDNYDDIDDDNDDDDDDDAAAVDLTQTN